jgi:hypothetical protein
MHEGQKTIPTQLNATLKFIKIELKFRCWSACSGQPQGALSTNSLCISALIRWKTHTRKISQKCIPEVPASMISLVILPWFTLESTKSTEGVD